MTLSLDMQEMHDILTKDKIDNDDVQTLLVITESVKSVLTHHRR